MASNQEAMSAVLRIMRFHDSREWPDDKISEWVRYTEPYNSTVLNRALPWALERERKPSLGEWKHRLSQEQGILDDSLRLAKAEGRVEYDCEEPDCRDTGMVLDWFLSRDPLREGNVLTALAIPCPGCRGLDAFRLAREGYAKRHGPGSWLSAREVELYRLFRRIVLKYWALWGGSKQAKETYDFAYRTSRYDASRAMTLKIDEEILSRVKFPACALQFDHETLEPLEEGAVPEFALRLKKFTPVPEDRKERVFEAMNDFVRENVKPPAGFVPARIPDELPAAEEEAPF